MSLDEFGTDVIEDEKKDDMRKVDAPLRTHGDDENSVRDGEEVKYNDLVQWTSAGPGMFMPVGPTRTQLKPGVYKTKRMDGSSILYENPLNFDDLIDFDDSIMGSILLEIDDFWDSEKVFKDYGFLHRRGYLLYGPPGSGKSCLVYMIINNIVKRGGIAIIANNHPEILTSCVQDLRRVEPNRNIVCVFEDIDAIISEYGEESVLSFLDGETQINKILNLATTNYPEKLDRRIVSRPRRFDRLVKIGMPSESIRKEYFLKKLNLEKKELDKWVSKTKDFSFAAMADLVINVKCFNNSLDSSVELISRLLKRSPSSEEFKEESVGFNV